ncbi:DBH-like monooxygenase protein 1 homolog [Ylistrum balloti]|uniref:DBH-like monooxygenase protein 1 homolog n=1 Tax=Ylistrum balloti TaxID=509963 RepID=UPI002905E1FC|nr:DBH-like monooxygenase protein 1 homolog [Ylistrum balloti]
MRFLVTVLCVSTAWGYRFFQDEIPNGDIVPHPCKINHIWRGVGHMNPLGGGSINPFGEDFRKAGMKWNKDLCQMDSDGDGKTNGEELGDPDCVWTKGRAAAVTLGLSHPGVCTPHSDPTCQAANTWVKCDVGNLQCDALLEEGTRNFTVRLPETVVPASVTTYLCLLIDLPSDDDYHLIAVEPVLDNVDVIHHIIMYAMDDSADVDGIPQPCSKYPFKQFATLISGWGVGSSGSCYHKTAGIRVGTHGFKKAILQYHWNNPERRSDYTDSSGLKLYYTPNRRLHDATVLQVGSEYLEIPPGEESVSAESWCSNECTSRYLFGPIYVTRAINHMHHIGRKQSLQQYRKGVWIRNITNDERFEYDAYRPFEYSPPLEILPGDDLKTTCTYRSVGRDKTTFKGDGTGDEMCYVFLSVYPAENVQENSCFSWKSVDLCKILSFSTEFPVIDDCNVKTLLNPFHPDFISLSTNLKKFCKPFDICTQECKYFVRDLLQNNKCFSGETRELYQHMSLKYTTLFAEIWAAIQSCETELEMDTCQEQCDLDNNKKNVIDQE